MTLGNLADFLREPKLRQRADHGPGRHGDVFDLQGASQPGTAANTPRVDLAKPAVSVGITIFALIASCLPFYMSVVPPMADLPAHVLVARIVAQYDDPTLRFAQFFTLEWSVAPTALFYVVFVQLQQLVGPFWDGRVYLTVWVALMWASNWYLARVLGRGEPWLAALVASPLAFCWYAYNGFLPFLMSLPLFTLAAAMWLDRWRPTIKVLTLGVLLPIIFGFHIVGAAAAACVICVSALAQSYFNRDRRPLLLGLVSVTPLVVTTIVYLVGQHSPTTRFGYADVFNQIADVIKFTCASLDDMAALLMVAWLGTIGLVFLSRWRDLVGTRLLFTSAAVLLALSVTMPQAMGALWPAGPRLLPFALVLLIASVRWDAFLGRALATCFVVLLGGLSLFTTRRALEIDRGFRDLIGAADLISPGSQVLPIIVDQLSGSRWTKPYLHVGSVYTALRGGSNPYVFAVPHVMTGATPLKYRHPEQSRQFAFFYDESRGAADYKGVSGSYDYVLLWGESPSIAGVLQEEMTKVYDRGDATLFARRAAAASSALTTTHNPIVAASAK